MLESIDELTKVRPHVHKNARFSTAEYQTYSEGYYTGVIMALRVADLAVRRFQTATRERRAATRRKRSA